MMASRYEVKGYIVVAESLDSVSRDCEGGHHRVNGGADLTIRIGAPLSAIPLSGEVRLVFAEPLKHADKPRLAVKG